MIPGEKLTVCLLITHRQQANNNIRPYYWLSIETMTVSYASNINYTQVWII